MRLTPQRLITPLYRDASGFLHYCQAVLDIQPTDAAFSAAFRDITSRVGQKTRRGSTHKHVRIVHGDKQAKQVLQGKLQQLLPGADVVVPA